MPTIANHASHLPPTASFIALHSLVTMVPGWLSPEKPKNATSRRREQVVVSEHGLASGWGGAIRIWMTDSSWSLWQS